MAKLNNRYVQFYTPGSAAVKVQLQEEQFWLPIPEHKQVKKTVIRIDPVSIIGFAVAICMLIMLAIGINQLNAARREVAALEHYVAQLTAEQHALEETYAAGYNLNNVEQQALNWGMIPQEKVLTSRIFISPDYTDLPEPTVWNRVTTYLADLFA